VPHRGWTFRVQDILDAIAAPDIPWEDMRAMRNFVVHEYFGVNDAILWDTVRRDLPDLEEPLIRLLNSGSG
jgi:uncharacterized protein with HEPN domain